MFTCINISNTFCNTDDEPKFYKPKSRMQELAEEFKKSKEISEEYKSSKVSLKVFFLFYKN